MSNLAHESAGNEPWQSTVPVEKPKEAATKRLIVQGWVRVPDRHSVWPEALLGALLLVLLLGSLLFFIAEALKA